MLKVLTINTSFYAKIAIVLDQLLIFIFKTKDSMLRIDEIYGEARIYIAFKGITLL
jgi:hypothetical protein